mmetsp:Transcript_160597/g.490933  ORF Transcript_160597/g.490933 Transcript_160597/m.490933 type:complete len:299 (+) Transcript_160597:62-958(+)
MDFRELSQTPEHVGPGKYLGHRAYSWEPSQVPFGSTRPRFRWGKKQEAPPAKAHRVRAHRAVEEEGQGQFEEETHKALESWLAKYKLNLADTVVFSLKVQNLDFVNLGENRALLLAFEEKLREAVASLAGSHTARKDVDLALSPGSTIGWTIIVQCRVAPLPGVRASDVAACAASEPFAEAVASALATVDGIQEASTATWPIRVGIFGTPKLEPAKFGCNTLMKGPDAPKECTGCGSYHFWLCCGCGVAQYEKPCASGCESDKFGWVCISSECKDDTTVDNAPVTCGCWRQAKYHISK